MRRILNGGREVRKQLQKAEIGTKFQQALKLQQEQMKTEKKSKSHERKAAVKQLKLFSRFVKMPVKQFLTEVAYESYVRTVRRHV